VSERALETTGIRLNFSVAGTVRNLRPVVEAGLLRICEEAVANAAKHAHPTQVEVRLTFDTNDVQLCIRDNGSGFDLKNPGRSPGEHFGLVGMSERVEGLSGCLSIDSARGTGTSLHVIIPTGGRQRGHSQESPTPPGTSVALERRRANFRP